MVRHFCQKDEIKQMRKEYDGKDGENVSGDGSDDDDDVDDGNIREEVIGFPVFNTFVGLIQKISVY